MNISFPAPRTEGGVPLGITENLVEAMTSLTGQ